MEITNELLDSVLKYLVKNDILQEASTLESQLSLDKETADNIYTILKQDGFIVTKETNEQGVFMLNLSGKGRHFTLRSSYQKEAERENRTATTQVQNIGTLYGDAKQTLNEVKGDGNAVQSDLRDSTLVDNKEITTNITNANSQKSFWQKTSHFIMSNVWAIFLALLIAYLIFVFGWNK